MKKRARKTPQEPSIASLVKPLLRALGENPNREGLVRTPARVEESLKFLTSGHRQSIARVLNNAIFEEPYDEMVLLKDIELFSLCEHHLLPFYGKCHVAYVPRGKVIGLSKIPRIVDVFMRRPRLALFHDHAGRQHFRRDQRPGFGTGRILHRLPRGRGR